jgi:hypothetical protein
MSALGNPLPSPAEELATEPLVSLLFNIGVQYYGGTQSGYNIKVFFKKLRFSKSSKALLLWGNFAFRSSFLRGNFFQNIGFPDGASPESRILTG